MNKKIDFVKMVASGNDFVVIEETALSISLPLRALTKKLCDRKYGVGADGVLLLGNSKKADVRMRIFNADGSEAEMCGNGARCAAFYAHRCMRASQNLDLDTKAGLVKAVVSNAHVKVKLTDPVNIALDIPLTVNSRKLKVNFVNTGVPHTVVFVNGLDSIDVFSIGRNIRYHKYFQPAGANVNFVEVIGRNSIKVRTYERGVEDETLACGTGASASALIFSLVYEGADQVGVLTKSGEVLKVSFERNAETITNLWLEGKATEVFRGTLDVSKVC